MKKLIAIFAVLLMAVPAMAAGPEWSFYGSQRVHTWYLKNDYGEQPPANRMSWLDIANTNNNQHDDWGLIWAYAPGSRIGAKAKVDKVSGHVELGLNMATGNGGNPQNGTVYGDGYVSMRRGYGVWKFADGAALKVGKDYSPLSLLTSGSAFDDDAGLLGVGDFYAGRPGQIGLEFGGFEIAFISNATTQGFTPTGTPAAADVDDNYPKVEARYTLKLDKIQIIPVAGAQYYKLQPANSTLNDEIDIWSYVLGGAVKADIGAFYITGQGAWGQNWRNARWAGGVHPDTNARASAVINGDGDNAQDAKSWQAGLIAGLKFTDTVKFELGGGYREDNPDQPHVKTAKGWKAYGQAVLTMAPGVFLVPEVGYYDFGKATANNAKQDNDLGYSWYAGAKWQIDF